MTITLAYRCGCRAIIRLQRVRNYAWREVNHVVSRCKSAECKFVDLELKLEDWVHTLEMKVS